MPRVKVGTLARRRRKRVLKLAKGYHGSKHLLYKTANEQVMHSLAYSYRDRKKRKSNFRKLWISRINAAARVHDMSYSRMINGLKKAGVEVNRKMMADIAINDPEGFGVLVETAKKGLKGDIKAETPIKEAPKKETAKKEAPKKETTKKETTKKEAPKKATTTKKSEPKFNKKELEAKTVAELKELCKANDLSGYSSLKKAELVDLLLK